MVQVVPHNSNLFYLVRYGDGKNSLMFTCRNSRNLSRNGDAMKRAEIEVFYPSNLYPFECSSTVLIEYHETMEGKTIEGIFVSENVPEKLSDYMKEQAKKKFFNQEGSI